MPSNKKKGKNKASKPKKDNASTAAASAAKATLATTLLTQAETHIQTRLVEMSRPLSSPTSTQLDWITELPFLQEFQALGNDKLVKALLGELEEMDSHDRLESMLLKTHSQMNGLSSSQVKDLPPNQQKHLKASSDHLQTQIFSTTKEVEKHYRHKALHLHPDQHGEEFRPQFEALTRARNVLRDEQTRHLYMKQMVNVVQKVGKHYVPSSHTTWLERNRPEDLEYNSVKNNFGNTSSTPTSVGGMSSGIGTTGGMTGSTGSTATTAATKEPTIITPPAPTTSTTPIITPMPPSSQSGTIPPSTTTSTSTAPPIVLGGPAPPPTTTSIPTTTSTTTPSTTIPPTTSDGTNASIHPAIQKRMKLEGGLLYQKPKLPQISIQNSKSRTLRMAIPVLSPPYQFYQYVYSIEVIFTNRYLNVKTGLYSSEFHKVSLNKDMIDSYLEREKRQYDSDYFPSVLNIGSTNLPNEGEWNVCWSAKVCQPGGMAPGMGGNEANLGLTITPSSDDKIIVVYSEETLLNKRKCREEEENSVKAIGNLDAVVRQLRQWRTKKSSGGGGGGGAAAAASASGPVSTDEKTRQYNSMHAAIVRGRGIERRLKYFLIQTGDLPSNFGEVESERGEKVYSGNKYLEELRRKLSDCDPLLRDLQSDRAKEVKKDKLKMFKCHVATILESSMNTLEWIQTVQEEDLRQKGGDANRLYQLLVEGKGTFVLELDSDLLEAASVRSDLFTARQCKDLELRQRQVKLSETHQEREEEEQEKKEEKKVKEREEVVLNAKKSLVGCTVSFQGLASASGMKLNGKLGKVVGYLDKDNRYSVEFIGDANGRSGDIPKGKIFAIRPENIKKNYSFYFDSQDEAKTQSKDKEELGADRTEDETKVDRDKNESKSTTKSNKNTKKKTEPSSSTASTKQRKEKDSYVFGQNLKQQQQQQQQQASSDKPMFNFDGRSLQAPVFNFPSEDPTDKSNPPSDTNKERSKKDTATTAPTKKNKQKKNDVASAPVQAVNKSQTAASTNKKSTPTTSVTTSTSNKNGTEVEPPKADGKPWNCGRCTYRHEGAQAMYLNCQVCGWKRTPVTGSYASLATNPITIPSSSSAPVIDLTKANASGKSKTKTATTTRATTAKVTTQAAKVAPAPARPRSGTATSTKITISPTLKPQQPPLPARKRYKITERMEPPAGMKGTDPNSGRAICKFGKNCHNRYCQFVHCDKYLTMTIPESHVGVIIGKSGWQVKEIMMKSRAFVTVDTRNKLPNKMMMVHVVGNKKEADAALDLVGKCLDVFDETEELPPIQTVPQSTHAITPTPVAKVAPPKPSAPNKVIPATATAKPAISKVEPKDFPSFQSKQDKEAVPVVDANVTQNTSNVSQSNTTSAPNPSHPNHNSNSNTGQYSLPEQLSRALEAKASKEEDVSSAYHTASSPDREKVGMMQAQPTANNMQMNRFVSQQSEVSSVSSLADLSYQKPSPPVDSVSLSMATSMAGTGPTASVSNSLNQASASGMTQPGISDSISLSEDCQKLRSFIESQQACIKGSAERFFRWLVDSEDITSISDLYEAVCDDDYVRESLQQGTGQDGLKGFKRNAFKKALFTVNESYDTTGANNYGMKAGYEEMQIGQNFSGSGAIHDANGVPVPSLSAMLRNCSLPTSSEYEPTIDNNLNGGFEGGGVDGAGVGGEELLATLGLGMDKIDSGPHELYCPISHELMVNDPVLASDGITYERNAIEDWFSRKLNEIDIAKQKLSSDPSLMQEQITVKRGVVSPVQNSQMAHLDLTPNIYIRNMAQDYMNKSRAF